MADDGLAEHYQVLEELGRKSIHFWNLRRRCLWRLSVLTFNFFLV